MSIKPVAVHVAGTGALVGELKSRDGAHRIAHLFLGAWPHLAPLILTDRTRNAWWTVETAACNPLTCDVALTCAPFRERTSQEPRAPFHLLPPIPRPPVGYAGYPVRRVDLATLRRVVEGLRRL
jgi:hypothetical protein